MSESSSQSYFQIVCDIIQVITHLCKDHPSFHINFSRGSVK